MEAGKLRETVRILAATRTTNDLGETVETWAAAAEVPAEVREMAAAEKIRNGLTEAVRAFAVRIRYEAFETLTSAHRLELLDRSGLILEIVSAAETERRRAWTIAAQAGRPNP